MAQFPSPEEYLLDRLAVQCRGVGRIQLREPEKLNSLGLVHLAGMLVKIFP